MQAGWVQANRGFLRSHTRAEILFMQPGWLSSVSLDKLSERGMC
jgi:hypothetical protein